MLFNSELFVGLFLPITTAVFLILGTMELRRFAIAWLVLASCIFYGWFRVEYLALLLALIVINYAIGIRLARDYRTQRQRPALAAAGVLINVAVLAYFKYTNFVIENANTLVGTSFVAQKIILPLGISFFIFQKIAFLIDAYRGRVDEYNFLDFSLFVMYFPQLIAGPITHHREMIPQFRNPSIYRVSPTNLAAGISLFAIGMFKKAVVADQMALWADRVFAAAQAGTAPTLLESWGGVLAFTFQIYFDFSAYTDMALGIALMMNLRLPFNFDSPYKATNIIDFWRRWHMTLSRFLRDYIYIPLGGNRRGPGRRYVNLMATMLIGGLWHGAAWTFVAWGALHGLYLIINHSWHAVRRRLGRGQARFGSLGGWGARILTFIAVAVAWVFFRAESFATALIILKGMIGLNGWALPSDYVPEPGKLEPIFQHRPHLKMLILCALLVAIWKLPNSQELLARFRPGLSSVDPAHLVGWLRGWAVRIGLVDVDGTYGLTRVTGWLVAGTLLGSLLFQNFRANALQPFIYFQF
jgi:alginate O-acetyltransferase complex protein AlgI